MRRADPCPFASAACSVLRRLAHAAVGLGLTLAALLGHAEPSELLRRYGELRESLRQSPFGREVLIESADEGDRLRGEVYAVLDHPLPDLQRGLREPQQWCEVLMLPFNTKSCRALTDRAGTRLALRIGRKHDQPVQSAYALDFRFLRGAEAPGYHETQLEAATGPLGTRDYHVALEAVPVEGGARSFMRLRYAYAYGWTGRMAMQGYLSTVGAQKVGFTVVGRAPDGRPRYIGGVRGAIERNVMRYYLAIDAYLDSLAEPPARQLERRLRQWFDATQRYPEQLNEMDRDTYLAMKRTEMARR